MNLKYRSSDSAKYTNKSSGTSSILSANIHHTKFYAGNRHHRDNHHIMTTSHSIAVPANVISSAPVHNKKFVNKTSCDNNNQYFINRFINNNNNSTHLGCNNNNNYSKSLSLNRHSDVTSTFSSGVGYIPTGTLTSPYAFTGSGYNKVTGRSTKSDIGVPIDRQMLKRNLAKNSCHKNSNNNNLIIHKSKSILLPSVHSDVSLYDPPNHPKIPDFTRLHKKDILNNNYSLDNSPICSPSALMSPSSKTGSISKLAYTNKHRFNNNLDNPLTTSHFSNINGNDNINVSHQGPLVYKNDIDDDLTRCDWNNSVFDNPIMTVSQKLPTPTTPATKHFHIQCETLL